MTVAGVSENIDMGVNGAMNIDLLNLILHKAQRSSDAAAPVMISTNSPVMTACRVRLKRIWNLLIMSPAFLEAFCKIVSVWSSKNVYTGELTSIALRRADCSQACPSARAQYRELARAYSRRLANTSSSISNAAKFASWQSVSVLQHDLVQGFVTYGNS